MWEFVRRHAKSIRRDDPRTWDKGWFSLSKLGFLGTLPILSRQMFENRVHPNLYKSFATLFDAASHSSSSSTKDDTVLHSIRFPHLRVNVGRISLMRPTRNVRFGTDRVEADVTRWRTLEPEKWIHWDMSPFTGATTTYSWRATDFEANCDRMQLRVQGILALSDCGKSDGGFYCIPGGHRNLEMWARTNATRDPTLPSKVTNPLGPCQFYLPPGDAMRRGGRKIPIRAGDLLVWTSKLPHCNYPNRSERPRIVQYVKMASAHDRAVEPLLRESDHLLPRGFTPNALGRKLLGFDPWGNDDDHPARGVVRAEKDLAVSKEEGCV